MTKTELIEKIAVSAQITKAAAGAVLNTFMDSVKKTLKKGNKVTLIGFGTFSIANRKARTGRNPQTGAPIKVRARKVPKFSAGQGFKDAVR